jgi:hypothetical protein
MVKSAAWFHDVVVDVQHSVMYWSTLVWLLWKLVSVAQLLFWA